MLRDPATGKIPDGIFQREQEFARSLPRHQEFILGKTGMVRNTAALTWTERGPTNVGGRTRALGIDIRTKTPPNVTILAGGASGGIWRSTDDGSSWTQRTAPGQIHSVTCIVQDTRAGNQDIWYAGSGEADGTAGVSGGNAAFRGDGIFKSTDNGLSWTLLPSTSFNSPQIFVHPFQYVSNVAVDTTNHSANIVYSSAGDMILRSSDAGASWAAAVGGGTVHPLWSDVQVASGGVVYAALSSLATAPGIWRSANGLSWTKISTGVSGFPTIYNRISIAIAPSNQNTVYFLVHGTNGTDGVNQINGHQLWKYTYVSGDGSGTGGTWENRGANLPSSGGPLGTIFDSQGGYDLFCRVKPDDPNFLIIGGQSMYRSTDAFASATNTSAIGGYDRDPAVFFYPNNHPDEHTGIFLPGSKIRFYNGNDGGIAMTGDITSTVTASRPVSWTSLNNGYNVTQFYSISLAPEPGSNFMVGGTQDNGSQIGNAPGSSAWRWSPEGGDGMPGGVAPLADDRYYTAVYYGKLFSYTRAGRLVQTFATNTDLHQLFVNPCALDPNNSSLLYSAAGSDSITSGVWRNDSVKSTNPAAAWTFLTTTLQASGQVSALGLSTLNSPNVLYFGTTGGKVFRVDNAATGSSPTVTNITGSLLPGYVICIAVDPTNSNNALLVYSNYNFQSLWYTTNGGTTWSDEEGNMAGNAGPSLRWAKIFYVGGVTHYFLAASTGIYYTTALKGTSTVWTQEGTSSVGNVVTEMLDWRPSDGTLAAATHGRGVFTTTISAPLEVAEGGTTLPTRTALFQNYPNPFNPSTRIEFSVADAAHATLKVFDVTGREVATIMDGQMEPGRYQATFDGSRYASGMYVVRLTAGTRTEIRKMLLMK